MDLKKLKFWIFFGLATICSVVSGYLLSPNFHPGFLEIELRAPDLSMAQVFFDSGKGFSEVESYTFNVISSDTLNKYLIPLPDKRIIRFRIDPAKDKGTFAIGKILLSAGENRIHYFVGNNRDLISGLNQIELFSDNNEDILVGESLGDDPYLIFTELLPFNQLSTAEKILHSISHIIVLITIIALTAWILSSGFSNQLKVLKERIDLIGSYFSVSHLIRFDWKSICFFFCLLLLCCVFVTFKFHMSSVAIWDTYLSQSENETSVVWGNPRSIRSDEWLVQTPFILSQVKQGFPIENYSLGEGRVPLVSSLPVNHFSNLFKPNLWGFFVFNPERGFSVYWAYKIAALLGSCFLLFMLLTRNNFWLSILGTLWIYLSSYTQWWFSTNLPELLTSFSFIVTTFAYLLTAQKRICILFAAAVFAFYSISFVLLLYPPFQVPLVLLGAFIVAGFLLRDDNYKSLKDEAGFKAFVLLISFTIIPVVLFAVYREFFDTINLMMGTVYPGRRFSQGGDQGVLRIFSGFFDFNYRGENFFPGIWGNVCEASNYLLLFPFVALAWMGQCFYRKKFSILVAAILSYILLIMSWMIIGFPHWLAKYSLLSYSPGKRTMIGLGIASIIVTITFLSEDKLVGNYHKIYKLNVGLIVISAIGIFGFCLRYTKIDEFYTYGRIIPVVFLLLVSAIAIVYRRKVILAIAIFIFTLQGWNTNPLGVGLSPIFEKDLARFVADVVKNDPDGRWMAVGELVLPNFLKTSGALVWNGVNYVPRLKDLYLVDKGKNYEDIYNRYAHITVTSDPENQGVEFFLKSTDWYEVKANLCGGFLKNLGIKYVVFSYEPSYEETNCLEKATNKPLNGTTVFRYAEKGGLQ